MEIAKIDVSRADARKVYCQTLTAGMAGVEVTFSFDDAWDGLHRIATFKAGGTAKDVLLTDDRCEIPPEVLAKPCARLVVGVYGERADGTLVIPTVWAELGRVEQGVTPTGDISGKHTPEVWAQIQGQIGNLKDLNTENKETLVAAINEAAKKGGTGGNVDLSGYVKTVNGVAPDESGNVEITIPDSGGNVDQEQITIAINTALAQAKASGEFDGKDGADGKDGQDGYTPQKGVDYFDGKDGKDGSPGSPGADGITPHIGNNGNWYIGETDTGKPSRGADGRDGVDGKNGQDGYTPQKGVDYFDGQPGKDGVDGKDGYTPVKGVDYFDGQPGKDGDQGEQGVPGKDGVNGKDGTSATHSWNGTVLTVTSASGTSSADLKGAKGDKGDKGDPGADGAKGEKGDKGDIGATGPQGPAGPQGETGPAGKDAESVPDYVRTEAETVARIINQHQSNDSIVFPFLSDAHCGYYQDKTNEATKLAGQLLNLIGSRVPFDFIANGGDMANGAYDTTREMTYEQHGDYTELTANAHKGVPAVWVPGNHDDAPYMATADRATQKDMFALIGRKSRVSGAVCPNGCNYGYLDLENRKLRVIYLDTDDKRNWGTVQVGSSGTAPAYLNAHNVGGVQLRWLAESALDFTGKANPAEWGIVVISHVALNVSGTITDAVSGETYSHSTENAATILNAYRMGKSGSITHNGVTVNYDFSAIENQAVIICAVHGHNHKFSSEELSGGIVSIGCPNVMNGRERASDDGNTYTKTAGTANGTSFCILTIDRENRMIYADCVGAGYDRTFEYTTEVVSYTNQLPISTDASGNVYNGKGFKENTYLSSGNDGAKSGIYATGFIPLEWNKYGNAVLNCKNVGMQTGQDSHRVSLYNADKSHINTVKTTVTSGWWTWGADGNIDRITVLGTSYSNAAFIRFCCSYIGEDSIVTVNEPIE